MLILTAIISYYKPAFFFNSPLLVLLFAADRSFLKEGKYPMQSTSSLYQGIWAHCLAMHNTEPDGTA